MACPRMMKRAAVHPKAAIVSYKAQEVKIQQGDQMRLLHTKKHAAVESEATVEIHKAGEAQTRGRRRNSSRRRRRGSRYYNFPQLCDEPARHVLESLMDYVEGLSADMSMEEPKEFGTVLMGMYFSFTISQEALERFGRTLESSILGSAATLLEDDSKRPPEYPDDP
ncbi:hypothetical protein ENH_00008820 [Eimeria necatrix]|uniref:Uncharacterized protein n=1 Tax=Eimeria necatrix TaxID=51315 RepID=U6MN81_9EIME|nr:hypothetical protein ENH_00008820 [Eimeria necatrix]CDJ65667.1 hypothetical protein ENH_00008820 [Eimeria necatrix]